MWEVSQAFFIVFELVGIAFSDLVNRMSRKDLFSFTWKNFSILTQKTRQQLRWRKLDLAQMMSNELKHE